MFRRKKTDTEERLLSYRQLGSWLWKRWKDYRLQAILNTLIGLVMVLTDLAFVWATKWAVDIATDTQHNLSLRPALWTLGGIVALQLVLGIMSRWVRAILGVRSKNKMQRDAFEHLLMSEWKGVRKFHTGHLLNRIELDVANVINFLTESIPSLVNTIVQFAGAFIFLFFMDSKLAVLVVLVLPFFLLSSKLYVRKMRRLTRKVRNSESQIQAVIQESLQHTLVIKTLERTTNALEKLSAFQRQLRHEIVEKTKYATISSGLMNFGFALGYMLTFTWGTVSLHRGLITYGALIAFVQLVGQIQGPVKQLTKFIPVFIGSFTAAERLIELEDIPLERKNGDIRLGSEAGVTLEHVSFAYAPHARKILSNFSFSFPSGSITAIVGETGSGKTTLIRLLLALVRPTDGHTYIYNRSGQHDVSPDTRCNFSYVPQGNTLLSGTIRENLRLGNPKATEAEMKQALDDACASFVSTLPDGLDSACGEMGDGLSEGQAQRIAIARALLKDAPLLLLDEATSALDADTESRVLRNIINRKRGRTILFVTHRPEALKHCTQTLRLARSDAEAAKEQA